MSDAASLPGSNPTALRLAIFDKGWQPIPVTAPDPADKDAGKKPLLPNWRQVAITPAVIRGWAAGSCRTHTNTGLRTRGLVAIDIDVLDGPLADRLLNLATDMLGATPLVRTGKAPKRLAVYSGAPDTAKARTPEFVFDDGSKSLVECLSDGQQFVAFGVHPGTLKPYRWVGASPLDTAVADLPVVDAKRMQAFLREAETMLRAAGGKTARELRRIAERPERPRKAAAPRPSDWPRPTRADVESALATIPNTHDWHGWYKIGAAIFDALGGEGEELFVRWSAQSSKDGPADTIAKYGSFSRSAPTVTSGSLFYEARNNGWLSDRELERGRAERRAEAVAEAEPPPQMDEPPIEAYEAKAGAGPQDGDATELLIAEFNTRFMVVNEDGRAVIYEPAEDPILHRRYHNRVGFADLRQLYMNRRVEGRAR
jgi:putative DNA primase/helicase